MIVTPRMVAASMDLGGPQMVIDVITEINFCANSVEIVTPKKVKEPSKLGTHNSFR